MVVWFSQRKQLIKSDYILEQAFTGSVSQAAQTRLFSPDLALNPPLHQAIVQLLLCPFY